MNESSKVMDIEGRAVRVIENPSRTAMQQLFFKWHNVRMIIDPRGNFFVWNGHEAIHYFVIRALGLSQRDIQGFVYPKGIGFRYDENYIEQITPTVRAARGVIGACGRDVPIFWTDDDPT